MTIVHILLLTAFVMRKFTESKSLSQAEKQTTCGIRRVATFDMMLTCYFHDNIHALLKDFTVYLYKEEQSPKAVLSCQWTPEILCHVAPGYEYEYDIDVNHDHTNVRILHAAKKHAGMYTCQVIGESDSGTCSLTEEQIQQNSLSSTLYTQLSSTTLPVQTTTTTSVLADHRQTQREDEQSSAASELSVGKDVTGGSLAEELKQTSFQHTTLIYVAIPVVLIGILVIILVIALYRRRCTREAQQRAGRGLASHSVCTDNRTCQCGRSVVTQHNESIRQFHPMLQVDSTSDL